MPWLVVLAMFNLANQEHDLMEQECDDPEKAQPTPYCPDSEGWSNQKHSQCYLQEGEEERKEEGEEGMRKKGGGKEEEEEGEGRRGGRGGCSLVHEINAFQRTLCSPTTRLIHCMLEMPPHLAYSYGNSDNTADCMVDLPA